MDERLKENLHVPGYNIRGSNTTINLPKEAVSGYKGSNDFVLEEPEKRTFVEQCKEIGPWFKRKSRNTFRKKILYKRVPILNWLPKYKSDDFVGDIVAGITIGLTIIPQALAYSGIAGLPAAYGLYGSFLGCFLYIFLGSCKEISMGPTAIAALLTFQVTGGVWQRAVLLSFMTGIIQILMGLLGLGFLLDFVSGPVSSGFTSAVAIIILSSQVKDIFGISAAGGTFVNMWTSIIQNIGDIRVGDTILGFSTIIVLLFMRQLPNIKIGPADDDQKTSFQKVFNKTMWMIGTSRNAIIIVVTGGIASITYNQGHDYFKLIGDIPPGLPGVQLPPFSIDEVRDENGTIIQEAESFGQMLGSIGSGLVVLPLITLLENISVCKAFANGKTVDATQELIALGVANLFNSFIQSFPGTGALSRGAVYNSSGVRTPLANLYKSILVIVSLLFLTPLFFYIPKASLAGLIIAAVIFMVEYKVVKPMWRSKKSDLLPGVATFIACLVLPLEMGILVGIGINIFFILYHAARPKIHMDQMVTPRGCKYVILTPDRCLIFPSVDYVRNLVNKQGLKNLTPVVIDCTHIYGADFTAANVIAQLLSDFKSRNQVLVFYNLKPSVANVFEGVDIEYRLFYDHDAMERAVEEHRKNSIIASQTQPSS